MDTSPNKNETGFEKNAELMLCPGCLAENAACADFCHKCGMPISSFATLDPIKHIYAQGWMYRKACSGKTTKIILIGMWLIFGPLLLITSCSIYNQFYNNSRTLLFYVRDEPLCLIFTLAFVLLYAAILYRVTKRYLQVGIRTTKPGHCEECGYNLFGLTEPRCPECGTMYYPDDVVDQLKEQEIGNNKLLSGVDEIVYVVMVCTSWMIILFVYVLADLGYAYNRTIGTILFFTFGISIIALIALTIIGTIMLLASKYRKRSWGFKVCYFVNLAIFVITIAIGTTQP